MTDAKKPTRGLGRGLDVLLPTKSPPVPAHTAGSYGEGNVFSCAVEKIRPQQGQPRQHIDPAKLDELAESIRAHGLIEPIVVRRRPGHDDFEIIAGERRWRASQRAGLREVLVVVRDVSAKDAFELALIENVQREDLDAIEFAEALDRLTKEYDYTQESLAARIGKDRSTVANALRLLKLPRGVRARVIAGELSEGHARALLGAPDEATLLALADKAVKGRLSVRQVEALVRAAKRGAAAQGGPGGKRGKSASVRDLEARLERKLGARCEVRDKDGKGELVVKYASFDELDRILESIL
ncbi:MAG: ParB/RepB/Spo0J family partition protein [Sorangiineae bacterium]|nr:ParB/RepB/Spo0J family partition protein [Polyangiaceae bacterium]MEB2324710.1 ParB/RepB/Spo0J family partition protein [Sorangiineae bacterium]